MMMMINERREPFRTQVFLKQYGWYPMCLCYIPNLGYISPGRITDITITGRNDVILRSVYCIPVHGTSLIHSMIIRSDYCLVLKMTHNLPYDIFITFSFLILNSYILCFPLSCFPSDYNSRAGSSCLVLPDATSLCTRSDSKECVKLENLQDKT